MLDNDLKASRVYLIKLKKSYEVDPHDATSLLNGVQAKEAEKRTYVTYM